MCDEIGKGFYEPIVLFEFIVYQPWLCAGAHTCNRMFKPLIEHCIIYRVYSQLERIIWMNSIEHQALLIEVKCDCITGSSPGISAKREKREKERERELMQHTNIGGVFIVRNINLCNVLILINSCWRCRKVTWMNRVYGNLHTVFDVIQFSWVRYKCMYQPVSY